MRVTTWALSAVLLLADIASAKAISFQPRMLRRTNDLDELARRAIAELEGGVERRSPVSASVGKRSLDPQTETTVANACSAAISNMTSVKNPAGVAGCYNILNWDAKTASFQADIRLYQPMPASGQFANVTTDKIAVTLNYAPTTEFTNMVNKRSSRILEARDGTLVPFQHYTMSGGLKKGYDMSKLNETFLASLLVPQMMLTDTVTNAMANMSWSDTAWFLVGNFTNVATQAMQVANPATALAATTAAKGFVLPGTTLGIFPTGLIITSIWTLFFFVAFGLGTIGRMKSRDVYRKRVIMGGGGRGMAGQRGRI